MAISCDICGVTSDTGEAFKKSRNPFTLKTRVRCPACWSGEQLSFSRTLLWALGGLAVAGGFLVWARPDDGTGWFLLNIFLFGLFQMLMIIPHELGHAFVARLLGVRVFKIIVGYGRTVHRCRTLGFSWEVKELPMGGLTVALGSSRNYYRLKRFLVVAAGSLVNLAVIIGSSCAARYPAIAWATDTPLAPIECLYLANMWILAVNLAPHHIVTPYGRVPSDGLALLKVPMLRRDKINELLGLYYVMEGQDCREKGDFAGALRWYETGRSRFPENNIILNNMGVTYLDLGQMEPARKIFLELLETEDLEPDLRPVLMNNVAYSDLLLSGDGLLKEADHFSHAALASMPWFPVFKGTRGMVLVERGDLNGGLRLLYQAFDSYEDHRAKATCGCYLAIGEKRKGNSGAARMYLAIARELDPDCSLLERAADEINAEEPN